MKVDLGYVKGTYNKALTRYKFPVITGIDDAYRGVNIRNRIIVKVDILPVLTMFCTKNTLIDYRGVVFRLMSGVYIESKDISCVMNALYQEDVEFHGYINRQYVFNEMALKESLYTIVCNDMICAYDMYTNYLVDKSRERGYKYVAESEGYVYLSVPDGISKMWVPEKYGVEVVSNAKGWDGSLERYEQEVCYRVL